MSAQCFQAARCTRVVIPLLQLLGRVQSLLPVKTVMGKERPLDPDPMCFRGSK